MHHRHTNAIMSDSSSSSSSSSSSGSTGPADPSSPAGAAATTSIAFYTSSISKAAATYVDFPTALLTAEHSVAPLPNKAAILEASPDPTAFLEFYNNSPEMEKLEAMGNANCHMAIYAWHAFAQLSDKQKSGVKGKIVTQSLRRISTNPTYLANSLIAYSAMACRGGRCITVMPTYCFHRVSKPLMGCSTLLELLLQRLEQLLVANEQAKAEAKLLKTKDARAREGLKLARWKLTGSDVVKAAEEVLTENPLVQEIHSLRIENGALEYDVSIGRTDKEESLPSDEKKQPEAEEKDNNDNEDDGNNNNDDESSEEELELSDRELRSKKRKITKAKPATPKRIEHWVSYRSLQTTDQNKELVSDYNRLCREQLFDCISYKSRVGVTVPEIVWKDGERVEVTEPIMTNLGWSDALWLPASPSSTSLTSVNNYGNRSNGNGLQDGHDNGNDDNDEEDKIVLKPSDEFFSQVQKYLEKLRSDKAKKQGEKKQTPKKNKPVAATTNGKEEAMEKQPKKNKPDAASTNGKEEVTETQPKKKNKPDVANTNGKEEEVEAQPNEKNKPDVARTNGEDEVMQE